MKTLKTEQLVGKTRMTTREIGKVTFDEKGEVEVEDKFAEPLIELFSGRVWIKGEKPIEKQNTVEEVEEKTDPLKEDYDKLVLEKGKLEAKLVSVEEKVTLAESKIKELEEKIVDLEKEETLEEKLQTKTAPQIKEMGEALGLKKEDFKGLDKKGVIKLVIAKTEK